MKRWFLILAAVLLLTAGGRAQSAAPLFEGELGAPIYSTLDRSGGVAWIAYGDIYAPGTFNSRPACGPPNVLATGRYVARVEQGGPAFYTATYRLTFGFGAEARQFVFTGPVEFQADELTGGPVPGLYTAAELVKSALLGDYQLEFTPRSAACLGGLARIAPAEANLKGERLK